MSVTGEERGLTDIEMLDKLINQHYQGLSSEVASDKTKNLKIGDLIKMIETRRKLAPGDGDQKEFWKMLDQIRQNRSTSLTKKHTTSQNAKACRKNRNRKTSAGSKAVEK